MVALINGKAGRNSCALLWSRDYCQSTQKRKGQSSNWSVQRALIFRPSKNSVTGFESRTRFVGSVCSEIGVERDCHNNSSAVNCEWSNDRKIKEKSLLVQFFFSSPATKKMAERWLQKTEKLFSFLKYIK